MPPILLLEFLIFMPAIQKKEITGGRKKDNGFVVRRLEKKKEESKNLASPSDSQPPGTFPICIAVGQPQPNLVFDELISGLWLLVS